MTLFEVNEAAAIIKETAHPDVNLIFGAVIDPNAGDELRITVIATGFERTGMPRRAIERPTSKSTLSRASAPAKAQPSAQPESEPARQSEYSEFKPLSVNPDDLDIPAFLRRR